MGDQCLGELGVESRIPVIWGALGGIQDPSDLGERGIW